jgi:hypothetical protein
MGPDVRSLTASTGSRVSTVAGRAWARSVRRSPYPSARARHLNCAGRYDFFTVWTHETVIAEAFGSSPTEISVSFA